MGDVPYPSQYKNIKPKCVELITEVAQEQTGKDNRKFMYTVVLQFSDCILASFMCKPSVQTDVSQFTNTY